MALGVVGSNPIIHPIFTTRKSPWRFLVIFLALGRSQAVRHGTLDPVCVGSNPAAPATLPIKNADVAEQADALDLGSSGVTSLRVRVPSSAPLKIKASRDLANPGIKHKTASVMQF